MQKAIQGGEANERWHQAGQERNSEKRKITAEPESVEAAGAKRKNQ